MALKLPRLSASAPIVDQIGSPTTFLIRWWNDMASAIEGFTNSLAAQVAAIQAVQAAAAQATAAANQAQNAADTAQNAAVSANSAAATAQGTADSVGSFAALQGSYVSPTNVLTATDAGASATITIANHNRVYGDGTQVAVVGGALTGLAYSTSYAIYYDQPSRAGGAVSYHTTTDPATASPDTADPDRHYVGAIKTPAAAGAAVTGIGAVSPNITLPQNFY